MSLLENIDKEFNTLLDRIEDLYLGVFDNFSDEELDLFGEYAVRSCCGYVMEGKGFVDNRPYSETFEGRLDYQTHIKNMKTN